MFPISGCLIPEPDDPLLCSLGSVDRTLAVVSETFCFSLFQSDLCFCLGGSTTGAVFNPALAFSTQFPCTGGTFAEYSLVYWLGPLLGEMLTQTASVTAWGHLINGCTQFTRLNQPCLRRLFAVWERAIAGGRVRRRE